MKYIKELRNRFFLSIVCWVSIFLISYSYKEIILFEILNPSLNYQILDSNYFIFTNITELFTLYFDLAFFLSTQLVLIYNIYSFLIFLSPGLYFFEYQFFKRILQLFLVFWVISIIFLNYKLIPFLWSFFLSLQNPLTSYSLFIYFEAKASEYISFFMYIYIRCCLQFQIIVILILFLNYFSINKITIKKYRNIFYYVFLLIATILTPPDFFSQLLVFFGLIFIFEIVFLNLLLLKHFQNII